jgi:hypothetical protein
MRAGRNHFVPLFVSLAALVLFGRCSKDQSGQPVTPTITSFTPDKGPAGTVVTITGTGFSSNVNGTVVYFNGLEATLSQVTSNSIAVTVPAGAATGKVSVKISNHTVESTQTFEVIADLSVASFSPARGVAGTSVTITGTGFSTTSSENVVTFNGVAATVTNATATALTVTVPSTAASGKISVTAYAHTVQSADSFEWLIDIPRNGLVAFYPFSGDAKDATANHLDGTAMNGPTLVADRFNQDHHAYSFDGVDDYITMGNPALLQLHGSFTVSGWMNAKEITKDHVVISKVYSNPSYGYNLTQGYEIQASPLGANGNDRLFQTIYSSVGTSTTVDQFINVYTNALNANQWYFFAMVIDGKSFKFYLDGALQYSFDYPLDMLPDGSQGPFEIGAVKYSSEAFFHDGLVDDVALYNRALTETEVTQLYQQTITKY